MKHLVYCYAFLGACIAFVGCKSNSTGISEPTTVGSPNPNNCIGGPNDIAQFARYALQGNMGPIDRVKTDHIYKRHVSGEESAGTHLQSWFPNNLAKDTLRDFLRRIQAEGYNKPKDAEGSYLLNLGFKVGCSSQAVEAAGRGGTIMPETKTLKVVTSARGDIITAYPYSRNPEGSPGTSPPTTMNRSNSNQSKTVEE